MARSTRQAVSRKTKSKGSASRTLDVLFVVSECTPLVKTGGLADVAGSLPQALSGQGCRTRVLLPAYRGLIDRLDSVTTVLEDSDLYGRPSRVLAGMAGDLDCLLLDAPHLYDRDGGPYTAPDRRDWADNDIRYAALAATAAEIGAGALQDGWTPTVIHGHDWQAGLVPFFLPVGTKRPATVFSIHNIAYQGIFGPGSIDRMGLPGDRFNTDGFEYYGNVSTLKAGLVGYDMLSTVSETYARELTEPAFGMGMQGVIAARAADMHGIVNGIDTIAWDPATDPAIQPFDARTLARRQANRDLLIKEFGLDALSGPVHSIVSRLTPQKGLDLVLAAVPALLDSGASLVLLGSGDEALEDGFRAVAAAHPGRVGVTIGYDEQMAHRIYAGADTVLVPSRFEPCGLTQLYGLRYGAVPIVARTGGLADTVVDANAAALRAGVATGLMTTPDDAGSLSQALRRAATLFAQSTVWHAMQRCGMEFPTGWDKSAAQYRALYDSALARRT